ncbi:spore germination protein GerPC [Thalassobacillus devorans]|uniref:spore germination protein GerPC n=1 Tax=Thalassobacillus devorans TaxID=279813 RepID=UPI000A1C9BA7|nr:spore germination protein GerPC [Thalassobacillus devorans]
MNYYGSWQQYMEQMMKQLQEQQKEIKALYQKLESLEQNHSDQPRTVIEKIEYNFDQLKIESLEGTLHIGLTPQELSEIDDASVWRQQNPIQKAAPKPDNQQVLEELDHYLTEQGGSIIRSLATHHEVDMNQQIEQSIVQDIRNQLPSRIEHYENQDPKPGAETIVQQIKTEIEHSIAQYLERSKGEDK